MIGWWKGVLTDIREKTAGMDKEQRLEYIMTYYWYYILFVAAGFGLLILLIRHLFFGEPPKEFTCVMVNQAVDYERDETLEEDFGSYCGIPTERISIDSDYVFSYVGKELEGANESSYEKFFFRWGQGEVDAVVMPESFYRYCKELEYEFADIREWMDEEQKGIWREELLKEGGGFDGLYVEKTCLMKYVKQEEEDAAVLVFLQNGVREEADKEFLAFCMRDFSREAGVER